MSKIFKAMEGSSPGLGVGGRDSPSDYVIRVGGWDERKEERSKVSIRRGRFN